MKIVFALFLILQLGKIQFSYGLKWDNEENHLDKENWMSPTIKIQTNLTKQNFFISNSSVNSSAYTNDNVEFVGINLLVESMTCTPNEDLSNPNYLSIQLNGRPYILDSKESGLCKNISGSAVTSVGPIKFQEGSTLQGQMISLIPVGPLWGKEDGSTKITLRAELVIKKTILLEHDLPQVDITVEDGIIYEIKLKEDDKLCTEHQPDWNCSLVMSLMKMECYDKGDYKIQINGVDKLSNENITKDWGCTSFDYEIKYPSPPKYFESVQSITLRSVGSSVMKPVTRVTISAQLFSTKSSPQLPTDYFACDVYTCEGSETRSAIPDDWKCDGKPQCFFSCYNSTTIVDESNSLCRWNPETTCWGCGYEYFDYTFNLWYMLFMVLFIGGFVTLIMVGRSLYVNRVIRRHQVQRARMVTEVQRHADSAPPSYGKVAGINAYNQAYSVNA